MDFSIIKKAGLGQLEFAKLCDVSRVTVSNWVLGRTTPNRHVTKQVARELALLRAAVRLRYLPGDIPSMHKNNVASREDYIHDKLADAAEKLLEKKAKRQKK